MRHLRLATALALALGLCALLPSAAAAAPISLGVWVGGQAALDSVHGVTLKADGNGKILLTKGSDRKTGDAHVTGTFNPSAPKLHDIRAAAQAAMSGPKTAAVPKVRDGFYAVAAIKVGSSERVLVGDNKLPPKLKALVKEINKALPANAKLARHGRARAGPLARQADAPPTAACPAGGSATTVAKHLTLQQAVAAGVVTNLAGKDAYQGDSIAVDADWQPVHGPVIVDINIEVIPPAPTDYDFSAGLKAQIEGTLNKGYTVQGGPETGTPVQFRANIRQRAAGSVPSPCWHQVQLNKDPNERGYVNDIGGTEPHAGEWSLAAPYYQNIPHEFMHLAGLDEAYSDSFFSPGGQLLGILPEVGLTGDALAQELGQLGLTPKMGVVRSVPFPGQADSVMATGSKVLQNDLKNFEIRARDTVVVDVKPGDLLLNKDGTSQNMAVGQPLSITVRKNGGHVHLDGIFAHCIDLSKHQPARSNHFDVLGPAAAQTDPTMQALARVLAAIARRGPSARGAQQAVWRVTDDSSTDYAPAREILAEAGVPPDANTYKFNGPHFADPNAGSPNIAAVSTTGAFPRVAAGSPPPSQQAGLKSARLLRKRVRIARRRTLLVLQVELQGARDRLAIKLERRKGRRWRRVGKRRKVRVPEGKSVIAVPARLRPGRWRLVVKGSKGKKKIARFTARRGRRHRR